MQSSTLCGTGLALLPAVFKTGNIELKLNVPDYLCVFGQAINLSEPQFISSLKQNKGTYLAELK
jgi:hypothetical protein